MSLTALKTPIDKISISNYKILELIGTGGMANIYRAVQLSLDRQVALKVMHPHLSMNEGFVARFEKEAKQAAQLHHENIVSIIDYGHENGDYFIAMEFVDGKNLRQLLEKQNRLPLEIALLICHQVADGLKYAHSQNLVHRDIKPANIILSNDGRVMITDFGIAKGDDDLSITATGQMIGSPAYMSPEQAAGKYIDHRTDIFSLGIIFYEILAGQKPFRGETYQTMVTAIMSQNPESLRDHRVDVNSEIESIVQKAIVKDVESRFQSAEEMCDAIYAQLDRFKLPPVRKLISGFLKNPGKVTEKLRNEKVSGHMESALYYLTLGESRLKDAKREFEDVLRFDKNNQTAREYLQRLENRTETRGSSGTKGNSRIRFYQYGSIGAMAIIFTVILIFMNISRQPDRGPVKSRVSQLTNEESVDKSSNGSKNQTAKTQSKTADESQKTVKTDTHNTSNGSSTKSTQSKSTSVKKKSSYNYPNQNLSEFGSLAVKTNTGATIFIDNREYGASNGPAIKLPLGRHFVEIKADGYRRMTKRIYTEKNKTENLKIDLIPERR